ncbi:MMPL family transporter [Streptomyces sp. NBC_00687]|uniref:MMPL family transporter n=1 Tax=Streptomyces sp. NBC_00687 TaxID=2975807 RepID=UPI00225A2552|nr:MMPL family transporter [Streptomyces sp. NBC_00687]MCX4919045.1 MMPL family transporter [Streptomyces sp. NBC_00687]
MGAFCARHPLSVIAVWLLVLAAALLGDKAVGATYSDEVSLPGSHTQTGAGLLEASDPALADPNGKVVFHVDSGTVSGHGDGLDTSLNRLRDLPRVTAVSEPVTSTDGATAYVTVSFDEDIKSLGSTYVDRLDDATAPALHAGIGVGYGGDLHDIARAPANDVAGEAVGIGTALVVLLLAFGSVAAALMPLATALISVGVGMGVVGIVAGTLTFATSAPTLALMIGLGVGIDYALFLTTRFRQDVMDGYDTETAVGRTAAGSGKAVLVAALTVAVALLSLYACGLSMIGRLGLAATIAVLITALAALTLVPAALGLVGHRVDRLKVRRPVAETAGDDDGWHRYARLVARRPKTFLTAGLTLVVLCAIPLFSLRLGHIDDGADPAGSTTRHAYDWMAEADGDGFGPGANGPFTVVVDLKGATRSADQVADRLADALAKTGGIARVTPPRPSHDGKLLVTTVTPTTGPQTAETGDLFETLTGHTLPDALADTGTHAHLTGSTAGQLEFRDTVTERLPVIIGLVLVCAFLLLMVVFRSLVIPLKAVVLNLLTTGASYGILVAVFQWGWGDRLLGMSEPVPIESYVPMMMFAIVFGLSMDYEIFLLSRIAEERHAGHDNQKAVGKGLSLTGRVITCAALIMTAVFLSFTGSPTVVVKMLALGLAISVILDATVVRLVLVPSLMFLFGRANWWLPAWLDRRLPHVSV